MIEIKTIQALLLQDESKIKALKLVASLNLPQGYISAGFIRNMVWDHLHGYENDSALNDIDVIYFDDNESNHYQNKIYEATLKSLMPQLNWEVCNQALMHQYNNDPQYKSVLDAMSYWPEKETALAVRLNDQNDIECISAFGLQSLFLLQLSHNKKRDIVVFENRVKNKNWLERWPKLTIVK